MGKYALSLLLVCLLSLHSGAQQLSALDVLVKSADACSKVKSASATADLIFKFFDSNDTIRMNGRVNLLKSESNASGAFGRLIKSDGTGMVVDKHQRLFINPNWVEIDTINFANGFEGNVQSNMLNIALFKNKPFSAAFSKGAKVSLVDSSSAFYKINITLPKEKDFDFNSTQVIISKENWLPVATENVIHYAPDKTYQYRKIVLHHVSLNDDSANIYLNEYKNKSFDSIRYTKPFTMPEPLPKGTKAPSFTFKSLSGDSISLESYKGKKVLIDCWYISCLPCQKSIPMLQELQRKYGDKLVVIGLNPFDGLDKMKAFNQKRKLNYTIGSVSSTLLRNQYSIMVFPSLYLIDENGFIISGHFGFPEETKGQKTFLEELSKQIEQ